MNNDKLFIPTLCKVGFQARSDTYTGKLGYIIAYDGKKWCKEPSWKKTSWGSLQYEGSVKLTTIEQYAKYLTIDGFDDPSTVIYYSNGDKKIISSTTAI